MGTTNVPSSSAVTATAVEGDNSVDAPSSSTSLLPPRKARSTSRPLVFENSEEDEEGDEGDDGMGDDDDDEDY